MRGDRLPQEAQRARNVVPPRTPRRQRGKHSIQTFYDDKEKPLRVPQSYPDAGGYPLGRTVSDIRTREVFVLPSTLAYILRVG